MIAYIVSVLSFLGMIDTFYLILSTQSSAVTCHVARGCTDVLGSQYSEVAGIPISWFGLSFYFATFAAAIIQIVGKKQTIHLLMWPATLAILVSITLTGIQIFVLKSYCEYCLASAILVTGIFLAIVKEVRK